MTTPALSALRRDGCALLAAAGLPEPMAECDILMAHVLGVPRVRLLVDPPFVGEAAAAEIRRLFHERARRVPSAYLTGVAEFRSREYAVGPGVLVPRPETEHLVDAALDAIPAGAPCTVVDVGTGSGCIAVSVALERPFAKVIAVDRSADALAMAVRNAAALGAGMRVRFLRGDLLEAVRGASVDVVVANPPYVGEKDEIDPEILHEPREALFAGPDGLDVYRRLVPQAARVLRPGGALLLETPGAQERELEGMCRTAGFRSVAFLPDLAGRPRVLAGELPVTASGEGATARRGGRGRRHHDSPASRDPRRSAGG